MTDSGMQLKSRFMTTNQSSQFTRILILAFVIHLRLRRGGHKLHSVTYNIMTGKPQGTKPRRAPTQRQDAEVDEWCVRVWLRVRFHKSSDFLQKLSNYQFREEDAGIKDE